MHLELRYGDITSPLNILYFASHSELLLSMSHKQYLSIPAWNMATVLIVACRGLLDYSLKSLIRSLPPKSYQSGVNASSRGVVSGQ